MLDVRAETESGLTPNGKVLRLATDGSVPADNPFGTAVYSLGHRNPQGIAFSDSGLVLATGTGPTSTTRST